MSKQARASKLLPAMVVVSALILSACGSASTGASLVDQDPAVTTTIPPTTTSTTAVPTTSLAPTTTTSVLSVEFVTNEGTAPHSLQSYTADLSIAMVLPDSTIEVTGNGVYTTTAFSCDWSVDILGQINSNTVLGSPTTVWLGGFDAPALPAESPEAQSALWLCPSSPLFWSKFSQLPDGGETEVKNDIPARRVDMTEASDGLPGMQFEAVPGVTLDRALVWIADPGDWVSAIELVMTVGPDAATSIWGIPFDPDSEATEMVYEINVTGPDAPDLEVSLPESIDFSRGFGTVTVDGDRLPAFESGALDPAIQMTAPTITGEDWNGTETSITADGRPKIILFLAHWCPHCQTEVPEVNQWLDDGNLSDDVDLYSVTVMTDYNKSNWPPQDWLIAGDWQLPVIMDDGASSAAFAYGVVSVPFYVVLDGNNSTLVRVSGGIGAEGLDTLVRIALGE